MKTNITSIAQCVNLKGQELVKVYNDLTGESVKKFSDRKTALRRIQQALQAAEAKGDTAAPEAAKAPEGAAKPEATKKAPKTESEGEGKARKTFDLPAFQVIKPHREGTKRDVAVKLLLKGATFEKIQEVNGWNRKDCYEGIRLLNTHLGYGLKEDDKGVITAFTL